MLARSDVSPEQLVAVLHTDALGRLRVHRDGQHEPRRCASRMPGRRVILPAQSEVRLRRARRVARCTSAADTCSTGARSRSAAKPARSRSPRAASSSSFEVLLSGRWQTFRTARTDQAGRWALPYRFARTRGVQRYRFRVELPHEAGYPFADGASNSLLVRVRGR